MRHLRVQSNEGIVEQKPEYTIDNFAQLGNQGSDELGSADSGHDHPQEGRNLTRIPAAKRENADPRVI